MGDHRVIRGKNDLQTVYPEIAKEWSVEKNRCEAYEISQYSNKKAWWHCSLCEQDWKCTVSYRTHIGVKCPYCSGRLPNVGKTDLETLYPEISIEWHPTRNDNLKANSVTAKSRKKVWWLGKCGHEWEMSVDNRTRRKSGCPYCANKKVLTGFNDLQSRNPALTKEWSDKNNISPAKIAPHSMKMVWWCCNNGHEWQDSVSNRSQGNGCPYCSGKRPIVGKTDLLSQFPNISKEWSERNQLRPSQVTAFSNKSVWWKCHKGHEWKAVIAGRTRHNNSCPYCSGRKVDRGVTDLATTDPWILEDWNYEKNIIKPAQISRGSSTKTIWWKCHLCGYEWRTTVASRVVNGTGCPYCQSISDKG